MRDLWTNAVDVNVPPPLARLPDGFEGVCKVEKTYVQETAFGPNFFCEMTTASGQRAVWKQDIAKQAAVSSATLAVTGPLNLNALRISAEGAGECLKDLSCSDASVECVFKNLNQRLITEINKHDYIFGCVAWLTHFDILSALATRKGVCIVVQKEDFLRPDAGGGPGKQLLRQWYKKLPGVMRTDFLSRYGAGLLASLSVCSSPDTDAVRCCGLMHRGKAAPRMHHKFVLFGDTEGENRSPGEAPPEGALAASETNSVLLAGRFFSHVKPVSVWTGSFNFTQNAVLSFENAVIISNPKIVQAYTAEFEQVLALSEPLDWRHEYVEPEYRIGT